MGIEEKLRKEAEENINDGTYIIDLDRNKVMFGQLITCRLT
jgi:hypothetical protein